MKTLLESKHFRAHVKLFIATNIRADIPDLDGHSLLSSSKASAVSFSCLVDPRQTGYVELAHAAEFCTVRAVQIHECT